MRGNVEEQGTDGNWQCGGDNVQRVGAIWRGQYGDSVEPYGKGRILRASGNAEGHDTEDREKCRSRKVVWNGQDARGNMKATGFRQSKAKEYKG